jgi:delta 1-pyrroline-5-carboxylate dehydrogenase
MSHVLHEALARRQKEDDEASLAEAAEVIDAHLDALIGIVQRTSGRKIEPYLEELRETVCVSCEYAFCSGNCPLREIAGCTLQNHAAMIFGTIRSLLTAPPQDRESAWDTSRLASFRCCGAD